MLSSNRSRTVCVSLLTPLALFVGLRVISFSVSFRPLLRRGGCFNFVFLFWYYVLFFVFFLKDVQPFSWLTKNSAIFTSRLLKQFPRLRQEPESERANLKPMASAEWSFLLLHSHKQDCPLSFLFVIQWHLHMQRNMHIYHLQSQVNFHKSSTLIEPFPILK